MEEQKMKQHDEAVAAIANKVKSFSSAGTQFRIYHGDTNSTRPSTRKAGEVVDITGLNLIIKIDDKNKVAMVESNVNMRDLVDATLKHGLLPQVVPEFPGITVGGCYSGTAAESSSFKFGYFDKSLNWAEFILADGRIVKASSEENADLFRGAVGACGTLGIGTLFELKLVTARPFVEVKYLAVHSMTEVLKIVNEHTENLSFADFVDGIMFSAVNGVMIIGTMVDEVKPGATVTRFTRKQDPWFFLRAHESVAHARDTTCDTCSFTNSRRFWHQTIATDVVPIRDYIFRYDRGAFWMGTYGRSPSKFNRRTRFLLDPFMRARAMYKTMRHSGRSQLFIIQDVALPQESSEAFFDWSHQNLYIYPIWVCPIKASTDAPLHLANRPADVDHKVIINLGIWGQKTVSWPEMDVHWGPQGFEEVVTDTRAIEAKAKELGGLKWLYAHNHYTEEEFWSIYDKQQYDELRKKYAAAGLPNLFEKTTSEIMEYIPEKPFWKSIFKTFLGRDNLLN
ncbi:Delta(24)-sterol reductase 3 [Colletotrichum chlorophyti]|uniref:Delta(24)-sterol reductase n=1 Tax=Colletotrichum chlorophyti TaxID=708187 RepID=A0A1Q8RFG7_9PEZI|nr:Delta(24)-sterol reductase 3 [Colletotrichum chlorophyti]